MSERIARGPEFLVALTTALLVGGVATLGYATSGHRPRQSNETIATPQRIPLGEAGFDPTRGTQLGQVDCSDQDPSRRTLIVDIPLDKLPLNGVIRFIQDGQLSEAVRFDIADDRTVDVTSWADIPGMRADLNRSYLYDPNGVIYPLNGQARAGIVAHGDVTTLRAEC